MIGKTISHYKIIEKLGGGGMGIVYKAQDLKLDRYVALKFLPPHLTSSEEEKQRFIHEAKAASSLDHNNICSIYEIDETEDGQLFISMAYYEGETLNERIKDKPLPIKEAIDIAIQIAQGLAKAHEKEIVHRDIKPANIMLTADGVVKILDFGLAKLSTQTKLTKDSTSLGTVSYMSPEQAKGDEVDYRTDIWSLGVVIHEMLSGQLPFKGEYDSAVIYSIMNDVQEPLRALRTGVPMEFERIINKCLQKNPSERYQHIDELIVDLRSLKKESESMVDTAKISEVKESEHQRFNQLIKPGIIILIAIIVTIIYFSVVQKAESNAPIPIAVVDFVNESGEEQLSSLSGMLTTALEQSRRLSVITRSRMFDILKQLDKENIDYIDEKLGREIANQAGIKVLVLASVQKFDQLYNIDLKVIDPIEDKYLFAASEKDRGRENIPEMIDRLAEKTREGLEENKEEIQLTSMPIAEITTPNLEAYQHYFKGEEYIDKLMIREADKEFEKAIALDSTFGLAYYRLAYAIIWNWDMVRAKEPIKKAVRYIDQMPAKEKYLVRFVKTIVDSGWGEAALDILREMEKMYPDDKEMLYNIGEISWEIGEFEEAIKYLEKVLEIDKTSIRALTNIKRAYLSKKDYTKALEYFQEHADLFPKEPIPYDIMGEVYLKMNDYIKSIEMYEKALKIKPDSWDSHVGIALNLINMGEFRKARNHLIQWSKFASFYNDLNNLHHMLAITYIAEGDIENTLKELENRGSLAKQSSDMILFVEEQFLISEILYENGKIKKAEEKLAAGKKLIESLNFSERIKNLLMEEYLFNSTRLAVKKGNIDQAKEYAEMYKKNAEKNVSYDYIKWYYALSGLIAYAEENYEKAISDLKRSDPNDPFINYHLALAYIKNGDETNAIDKLESAVNFSLGVALVREKVRVRAKKQLSHLKAGHKVNIR